MIISRAPLRIPLGGGGTDFPSYYTEHGGYILGFALNRYVKVVVHSTEDRKIRLKYSKTEECDLDRPDDLENRVAAEALKWFGFDNSEKGIEVVTFSDVPECSGLGGSSAFCVALVRALAHKKGIKMNPYEVFAAAWEIERKHAGESGGMQDQFFASLGGAWRLHLCNGKDTFDYDQVDDLVAPLLPHLHLVYAGGRNYISHSSVIAKRQDLFTSESDRAMVQNLGQVKAHGLEIEAALRDGSLDTVGDVFNEHWETKKRRDSCVSNSGVDQLHKTICNGSGAVGAKLIGLGGGGYFLCYSKEGLDHIPALNVGIDSRGGVVIFDDEAETGG